MPNSFLTIISTYELIKNMKIRSGLSLKFQISSITVENPIFFSSAVEPPFCVFHKTSGKKSSKQENVKWWLRKTSTIREQIQKLIPKAHFFRKYLLISSISFIFAISYILFLIYTFFFQIRFWLSYPVINL